MLKLFKRGRITGRDKQPPLGGCVLKRLQDEEPSGAFAAAFRRLCVETVCVSTGPGKAMPAAFRRLCVETHMETIMNQDKNSRL